MQSRVIQLGSAANQITSTRRNPQRQRVYDANGICPTINTMGGGGREPLIIEDFYQGRPIRTYSRYAPAIRSERNGLKVIECR